MTASAHHAQLPNQRPTAAPGAATGSLGRLEAVDARTSRLTGSTVNPYWYAEQLAVLPAPFRVVGGVELQETTRVLGERLLAAASAPRSARA
jgi:hypothetical protein